jgi:hypothetical protein
MFQILGLVACKLDSEIVRDKNTLFREKVIASNNF